MQEGCEEVVAKGTKVGEEERGEDGEEE